MAGEHDDGGLTLLLDETCTQAHFAELVGVTQQAVSEMVGRGALNAGDSLRQWLLAYCQNLRGAAAGRDTDLAFQRAELARVTRERAEIKLALERKEFAPVAAIEEVLAHVGRVVAGHLEPLPGQIHKLCPVLTPEDVNRIQGVVAQACDLAAGASLALLDTMNAPESGEAESDAEASEEAEVLEDDGEVLA